MRTSDELMTMMRERGLRVTPQRMCIVDHLVENAAHPTVEALYEATRVQMPTISLKTVYQTVHDLEDLGQVRLLDVGTGQVRVDPNVEHGHHHLVCSVCGRVSDVPVEFPRSSCRVATASVSRSTPSTSSSGVRAKHACNSPARNQQGATMPDLDGSKTHDNLKEAFAGESQANRRYLYFAQKADVEGYPDVAALFRSVAEGETGHAFGHFDFLAEVGDPVTGVAVGDRRQPQVGRRRRDLRVHRDVPGLRVPHATKASKRSRNGSRRSPAPRRATPAGSSRDSNPSADGTRFDTRGPGTYPGPSCSPEE